MSKFERLYRDEKPREYDIPREKHVILEKAGDHHTWVTELPIEKTPIPEQQEKVIHEKSPSKAPKKKNKKVSAKSHNAAMAKV
jgi:hypothetical protein